MLVAHWQGRSIYCFCLTFAKAQIQTVAYMMNGDVEPEPKSALGAPKSCWLCSERCSIGGSESSGRNVNNLGFYSCRRDD